MESCQSNICCSAQVQWAHKLRVWIKIQPDSYDKPTVCLQQSLTCPYHLPDHHSSTRMLALFHVTAAGPTDVSHHPHLQPSDSVERCIAIIHIRIHYNLVSSHSDKQHIVSPDSASNLGFTFSILSNTHSERLRLGPDALGKFGRIFSSYLYFSVMVLNDRYSHLPASL